ncbi:beta-galactosidase [Eubacterium ruminantium]|nr:beta-galactosidase [Eubacterium ruminantium]
MSKIYINDGWGFTENFTEELHAKDCSIPLSEIRVPHTVKETPFNYFDEHIYQMISGYRKEIDAPKDWVGKKILLTFEAVGHISEVYLNGKLLAEHNCGYTAFTVDLSDEILTGAKNILVVKCNSMEDVNVPPFGFVIDYMTYGGIYRDVYLEIKEKDYIKDVFVRPEVPENEVLPGEVSGKVKMNNKLRDFVFDGIINADITLKLSNVSENDEPLAVAAVLFDDDKEISRFDTEITGDEETDISSGDTLLGISFDALDVKLWDVTFPKLYTVVIELIRGDKVIDEFSHKIGFRRSEFKKEGYYLNGRKLKIRGLNHHQCYPYFGYAAPKSLQVNDADILKYELGVNATRTSHYPQSHYFINRCDEIGLLVFTEMPGWQHIGDEAWKEQAVKNTEDMVKQYRNHPSIILWGVRINESMDDDAFYEKTNEASRRLDPTRPTGGVRNFKKSHLLEDVYTYNDFSHVGNNAGVERKAAVTSDNDKPFLISEYNGHMYPTKSFDNEEIRLEHAMRHANVLETVSEYSDISGSFAWCMFDYNTHKDFGSGDRICYHGVMDMFRNPKMAAAVYAMHQRRTPVLEVGSSMDIGEHPAGNKGDIYIFTNADSVKMYKNDVFIKEYTHQDSPFSHMKVTPILIDDYVGDQLVENEGFTKRQAEDIKELLNYIGRFGMVNLPVNIKAKMAKVMTLYHMKYDDAFKLFGKYIGNWGGEGAVFRFEAISRGKVVKTVTKTTVSGIHIEAAADHTFMLEDNSYDMAAVRIRICDQNGNTVPFFNQPLPLKVEGPLMIVGPKNAYIAGGMGGTYLKTVGEIGDARLTISLPEGYEGEASIDFTVGKI